jgi:type I restriction enzyme S subunit
MLKEKMLVPQLRFSEFEGEWVEKKLGNVTTKVGSGSTPKGGIEVYTKTGIPFIRSQNVYDNQLQLDDIHIPKSIHKKMAGSTVLSNDILLNITGASIGRSCIVPYDFEEGNVNQHVSIIRLKEGTPEFLQAILSSEKGQKLVYQSMTGSGREGLNFQSIRSFKIVFPKPKEQQKIANFLSAIDNRIQTLVKKKTLLEQYKKGVMQKIFKQELRFKDDTSTSLSACDGKEFADWEKRRFSDVLFEHKLKSTGKEKVHSVSVHKGVINQIEHLGRSFSAKNTDHYSRALPNDIIYTKSPTGDFPLGIIKQNHIKEDVIISPLYGAFTPETKELGYILHVYFESPINTSNYLSSIIQKGAKNTINITNNTFLSKKMLLPVSKEEQTKIANFLSSIDKNIALVTKKIEHTKTFKKGLLQQMFV